MEKIAMNTGFPITSERISAVVDAVRTASLGSPREAWLQPEGNLRKLSKQEAIDLHECGHREFYLKREHGGWVRSQMMRGEGCGSVWRALVRDDYYYVKVE